MNHPRYRIETEHLVLRCWDPDDAPLLKAAVDANLDYLRPWMPWIRFEPTSLDAKVDLLRGFRAKFDTSVDFTYGVFNKSETEVWGGCGLHRRAGPEVLEIGYWITQTQTGRGLATELARALTTAAFEVDGIDRVEIHHEPANLRSRRVPEKLGFTLEAVRRRTNTDFPGEFRDSVIWTTFRHPTDAGPRLLGLDHVQVAIPPGAEAETTARSFYTGVLGFPEIPKPENLRARGGFWVQIGVHQLHLGVAQAFVPAIKAHPAFLLAGLATLRNQVAARGAQPIDDEPLPGADRFFLVDPFGNRLEFLERRVL
jgi:RimJ/RimL family protein N-acetyltransferase